MLVQVQGCKLVSFRSILVHLSFFLFASNTSGTSPYFYNVVNDKISCVQHISFLFVFVCLFLLGFTLGATHGSAQDIHLVLHSGITYDGLWGTR